MSINSVTPNNQVANTKASSKGKSALKGAAIGAAIQGGVDVFVFKKAGAPFKNLVEGVCGKKSLAKIVSVGLLQSAAVGAGIGLIINIIKSHLANKKETTQQ